MNEIRDAKFFGARIGDTCYLDNIDYKIIAVEYYESEHYKSFFNVILKNKNNPSFIVGNGEDITFEPPKKKVRKEIDCFVYESTTYKEYEKYSVYWNKETLCPEYRDDLIPAKLTFETWE